MMDVGWNSTQHHSLMGSTGNDTHENHQSGFGCTHELLQPQFQGPHPTKDTTNGKKGTIY